MADFWIVFLCVFIGFFTAWCFSQNITRAVERWADWLYEEVSKWILR